MAQIMKIAVFVLAFVLFVHYSQSAVTFTGEVSIDFNETNVAFPFNQTTIRVFDNQTVSCSNYMKVNNLISGWDVKMIAMQYDWQTDTMYIGWDCWGICGDADGDGNPSRNSDRVPANAATANTYFDSHLQINTEYTLQTIWTHPPSSFHPPMNASNYYQGYLPDVMLGDSAAPSLTDFDSYIINLYGPCDTRNPPWPRDSTQCKSEFEKMVINPSGSGVGQKIYTESFFGRYRAGVQGLVLSKFPNTTWPDIEFRMPTFSKYGNFTFRPGVDNFTFASHATFGASGDSCGEEKIAPFLVTMPCTVRDFCGVCGGSNLTCMDCDGVPNGHKEYDECGVCGGDDSSCMDCESVPNGGKVYDFCGVCGGSNETCLDCSGVANGHKRYDHCGVCDGDNTTCWDCAHVPNGPKDYDECGVCGGDGSSCWDCAHVSNGGAVYDFCGVCDGNNETCLDCSGVANGHKKYDHCGVCDGDNTTCWDCAHVPNGPKDYDECGVCGGDGSSCWDCEHVSNGGAVYDFCGVCNGNNETCLDCSGVANGNKKYDHCGVCDGDNTTCWDCSGTPNGPKLYDYCGVCNGDNSTCWDCAGIPNGGKVYDLCGVCGGDSTTCADCTGLPPVGGVRKVYDECGVCDGDNSTCWDCAHIPNGPWVYDLCGVCGGHNEDCDCWIYSNFSIIADDTYISIEERTRNFDKEIDLVVSSNKERTLLKFDDVRFKILGATEQKPIILAAKLRVYIRGVIKLPQQGFEDNKLVLHNLDNNFCAEKATWECRDMDDTGCCVEWKMSALYPKIKADYAWEETASVEVKNFQRGWVEFDVQEDIEDFLANSFLNSKSYLLKKGCEKDYGWIRFWSSESAGQVNAPELSIALKARCGAEPPVIPPSPCDDEQ